MEKIRYWLSVPFRIIAVLISLSIFTLRYSWYLLVYPLAFFVAVGTFIVIGQWKYQGILDEFKCDFDPI